MKHHKQHKVLVYSVSEIVISHDDPIEAQAIAEKLFHDDISSKSEMFSVRVERLEAQPLEENPTLEASVTFARCGTCGWYNSFPSLSEAPSTCPTCASNLVIRNGTDTDKIVYPVVTRN